jgi:lysophospholipase L1-like esterase
MSETAEREEFWDDDVHLTEQGYNLLAQIIYDSVSQHLNE